VSGSPLIRLDQVSRSYSMGESHVTALHSTTLNINEGEFVAIVGPSGSGKSTLLNLITGIDKPSLGTVLVGDTVVSGLDEDSLARWRGKQVGLVFQFFQLLPTLTALENVILPMQFVGSYSGQRRTRALSLLEGVRMRERWSHLPSELSGGEQQRVAIARAMANDPPLLIADEPTGNLDTASSGQITELLHGIHEQGKTIILVTHQLELAKIASRVIRLQDGRVAAERGDVL
jgi:putative ABC transport system ATP-binding protein